MLFNIEQQHIIYLGEPEESKEPKEPKEQEETEEPDETDEPGELDEPTEQNHGLNEQDKQDD